MFEAQITALRFAAKATARRVTWSAVGGLLILAGLVFLGVAGWIVMTDRYGVLNTSIATGLVLVVFGLLALAFSRRPPRVIPKETASHMANPMQSPALSTAAIINAVVMGVAAGRAMRRKD